MCHRTLSPGNFSLRLLETGTVKNGSSVRKLKRDEQSLFRGKSPGFVDLPLNQHIAKLTRPPRRIKTRNRGCRFRFHGAILHGNVMLSPLRTMTLQKITCDDENTFTVRLIPNDCAKWHRARSNASMSQYSCLLPFLLHRQAIAVEALMDNAG